jgi:hypothetical protein
MPRRSATRLLLCVIAIVGGACTRESGPAAPDIWTIDPEPRLSVGDRADSDSAVFARITDARLLRSGVLAVADGGAFAVFLHDSTGARFSSVGRRGRGPGEFLGGLTLVELPGDSVAVWDSGQLRWTGIAAAGGGATDVTAPLAVPTLLHAGLLVHSDLSMPPAWVPRLLTALSAASAEVRIAHLDESALLWVSQDAALREWRIFADSGDAIATLTLPEGVSALHFGRETMVGLATDSLGLQRVVVHGLRRGPFPAPNRTPAAAPAPDQTLRRQLMSSMRNAVTAQELHYMTHNGYTMHADSLSVPLPPGARFKIVTADARGWRGLAWYEDTGFTCGMFVGVPVPPGWSEGEVRCGW